MRNRVTLTSLLLLILFLILTGCQSKATQTPPFYTQTNPPNKIELATTVPTKLQERLSQSTLTQIPKATSTFLAFGSGLQLTYISYEPTEKPDDLGFNGIYAVNIDCLEKDELCIGEPKLLFQRTTRIGTIEWSPDGKKVAYTTQGNIMIADSNGENEIQVPSMAGSFTHPHWSPDGKMLAYIFGSENTPARVLVYHLDTGQSSRVIQDAINPMQYYWISKDQIAYIANVSKAEPMAYQITIASEDGTILKQFPKNYQDFIGIYDLTFSPDHRQIIFSGRTKDPLDTLHLFYSTLEGDSILDFSINNRTIYNFGPVWSPIGNWIAFEMKNEKTADIYIMKLDGTHLGQATHNSYRNISPAWRWIQ